MLRTFVNTFLALAVVAGTAAAQTTTPAPSPNQGAFDKLSPGNQKIVNALCNAQQGGCPTSSGGTTLTKDQIAAMKQQRGWGEIFKEMKANGQIPPDVKNLGQLVSGKYQAQSATAGSTPTSGSGQTQSAGTTGKPTAVARDDPRVRVTGSTLQEAEQKLFAQQGGLAQGNSKFDARFRDLSLTQADRQRLLQDIQKLSTIPEGSRVRYEGLMDGQRFHVDVWNRKGEFDVRMNGVQFGSREEAQAFIDSLRQAGADQIQIKGTIDGQRFHASFQDHNGRVKQQFRVNEPKSETVITTASGRSQVVGNSGKPESAGKSGKDRSDDDASAGAQGSSSGRGSFGSGGPGNSGHGGGRGK